MSIFEERRSSKAAQWSRRLAAFALVLLLIAAPSHRFGLLETVAFFWVLGVVGLLDMVAFGLAAHGYYRLWQYGERAGRESTRGLVLALIVSIPFLVSGYRILAYPRLHDVSTDVVDPPAMLQAAGRRTPQMNLIGPIRPEDAALQARNYPELTGRRYAAPPERVLDSIITVIRNRGWQLYGVAEPPTAGAAVEVEAAAGSFLLNLPADVSVRLTDEEVSSYVDVRSSSRYGLHDFGDNASRVASFLVDLDAAVAAQAALPPEPAPAENDEAPADGEPAPEDPQPEVPVPAPAPAPEPALEPEPLPEPVPAPDLADPEVPADGLAQPDPDDSEIFQPDPDDPEGAAN
ncbi:MAG: DUF1499 domain-containing protein [Rhizobiaceae bacterium]|nr:DUF1499 domain-containing protein [Rhizobiaceae bacterium]